LRGTGLLGCSPPPSVTSFSPQTFPTQRQQSVLIFGTNPHIQHACEPVRVWRFWGSHRCQTTPVTNVRSSLKNDSAFDRHSEPATSNGRPSIQQYALVLSTPDAFKTALQHTHPRGGCRDRQPSQSSCRLVRTKRAGGSGTASLRRRPSSTRRRLCARFSAESSSAWDFGLVGGTPPSDVDASRRVQGGKRRALRRYVPVAYRTANLAFHSTASMVDMKIVHLALGASFWIPNVMPSLVGVSIPTYRSDVDSGAPHDYERQWRGVSCRFETWLWSIAATNRRAVD
jgi:hypothetical protein